MSERIVAFFNKLQKNKHIKYGLPFFGLIFTGVYILMEARSVRYEFPKVKNLNREEIEALGINMKDRSPTLEETYEKVKKMDIDNWENIRGPRLWEEPPSN